MNKKLTQGHQLKTEQASQDDWGTECYGQGGDVNCGFVEVNRLLSVKLLINIVSIIFIMDMPYNKEPEALQQMTSW